MVSIANPQFYPEKYSPPTNYPTLPWMNYDKLDDKSMIDWKPPIKWIDTQPVLIQKRPYLIPEYEDRIIPIVKKPDDSRFDTDPDYTISQDWLLNNRQGDQYDRLPERRPYPELANETAYNLPGVTTLNRGRVWYGLPIIPKIPNSPFYEKYQEALEYSQTQIEEENSYF